MFNKITDLTKLFSYLINQKLLLLALVIIILSSLGTYWYLSNQSAQLSSQQNNNSGQKGRPTSSISPTSDLSDFAVLTVANCLKVDTGNSSSQAIINQLKKEICQDSVLTKLILPDLKNPKDKNTPLFRWQAPFLSWQGDDGWIITVPNPDHLELVDKSTYTEELPGVAENLTKNFTIDPSIIKRLIGLFEKNGLVKSSTNSQEPIPDGSNWYNYAAAGTNNYCILSYEQNGPSASSCEDFDGKKYFCALVISLTCVNNQQMQMAHDIELPFLRVLNDQKEAVSYLDIKGNVAIMGSNGGIIV